MSEVACARANVFWAVRLCGRLACGIRFAKCINHMPLCLGQAPQLALAMSQRTKEEYRKLVDKARFENEQGIASIIYCGVQRDLGLDEMTVISDFLSLSSKTFSHCWQGCTLLTRYMLTVTNIVRPRRAIILGP
jgi:hypothetical protein